MSDFDVALRLKLLNELSGPAKVAAGDMATLKATVSSLDGVNAGAKLAKDLGLVDRAADQAGAELRDAAKAAAAIGQADGAVDLARDLGRAGQAADTATAEILQAHKAAASLGAAAGPENLAQDLKAVDSAAGQAGAELQGAAKAAAAIGQADGAVALARDLGRAEQAADAATTDILKAHKAAASLGASAGPDNLARDLKAVDRAADAVVEGLAKTKRAVAGLGAADGASEVTRDLKTLDKAVDNAAAKLSKVVRAFSKLGEGDGAETLARDIRDADKAADAALKSLARMARAVERIAQSDGARELARDLQSIDRSADRVSRDLAGVAREAAQLGRGDGAGVLRRGLEGITRQAREAAGAVAKVRQEHASAVRNASPAGRMEGGGGGSGFALPLGMVPPIAAGALAYQTGKDMFGASIAIEKSLAEVRKFYDLDDPFRLGQVKAEILGLVDDLKRSPEAIGSVYARAGQQGIPLDQVRNYAREVIAIATAWDTAEEETANAIGTLKTTFDLDQAGIMKTAGAINAIADGLEGPVSETGLLDFLNRTGNAGRRLGMSAKEIAAIGGAFASIGRPIEVAGSAVNAIISKLENASSLPKDAQAAIRLLGTTPKKLEKDIKAGGIDGFLKLLDRIKASPHANKIGFELFGLENVDEFQNLLGALDQVRKALKLVEDDSANVASLKKTFDIFSGTTAANIAGFKANLQVTGDALASDWLPAVNGALERFNTLMRELRESGTVLDEIRTNAMGFAQGMGYDGPGAMLDDIGRRLGVISQSAREPGDKLAQGFEAARQTGVALRQMIDDIAQALRIAGDSWTSLFGEGDAKKAATERLNNWFADLVTDPKTGTLDALAMGLVVPEEHKAAARKRRADREAATRKAGERPADVAGPDQAERSEDLQRIIRDRPSAETPRPPEGKTARERLEDAFAPLPLTTDLKDLRDALRLRRQPGETAPAPPPATPADSAPSPKPVTPKRVIPLPPVAPTIDLRRLQETFSPTITPKTPIVLPPRADRASARPAPTPATSGDSAPSQSPATPKRVVPPPPDAPPIDLRRLQETFSPTITPKTPITPPAAVAPAAAERAAPRPAPTTASSPAKPDPIVLPKPQPDRGVKAEIEAAYGLDLGRVGEKAMADYVAAINVGGSQAVSVAQGYAAQIKAAFGFTVEPTISPRYVNPGPPAAGTAPAAPAAAPGKQSAAPAATRTQVAGAPSLHLTQHIYGQSDPKATARVAERRADRAIRQAQAGALHDLGSATA
ncbi:phage tail tape measure protein [Methylopila sp. 73B]|uniref:phage tail tape measure protein n=1 Tax=Methylopila sp. 73B TaxID=1120792 RepID=UPI00035F679F|nr:phage tail tape measure protein [Methylopila sp. 73B]